MLEIARLPSPHGVRGDVNVVLTSNRTERVDSGSVLSTPGGPMTVVSSRPHKNGFIVKFEGVNFRDQSEALRNTVLSAEPIDDPDELWIHELFGAMVIDQGDKPRGRVARVLENPASDILELDTGHLVPVQFIVSYEPGVEIRVDVPNGLFDLDNG